MNKYIDAEELIAEIERFKQGAAIARFDNAGENADYFQGKVDLCDDLTHLIASLQQEQPELPQIGYAETYYQKGLHDGIIKGQIEILKGLEEIEKRKAEPVLFIKEQEQPEVEVELEEERETSFYDDMNVIARHFYGLGLNARKEE